MDNPITIEGPGPMNPIGTPKPPIDWTKPVQMRIGYPVKIYAIDHSLLRPVIGVEVGGNRVHDWFYDGSFLGDKESCMDLFNAPVAADTGAK